jgi:hypothetical protein
LSTSSSHTVLIFSWSSNISSALGLNNDKTSRVPICKLLFSFPRCRELDHPVFTALDFGTIFFYRARSSALLPTFQPGGSVSRLNCCWSSPAQSFLASGLVETFDQDFLSLSWTCTCLRNGASSRTSGGVGLSVEALRLLHRSLSTRISALSQHPGPYGHCPPPSTWRTRSLYLCSPGTGWPIIPPGTGFPFHRLLRLAGLGGGILTSLHTGRRKYLWN